MSRGRGRTQYRCSRESADFHYLLFGFAVAWALVQATAKYETWERMKDDDDYVGEGERAFKGFDTAHTSLLNRVLTIERKLDK
ncbi:hypothetical protein E2C01_084584 [Portunus trituberculatus]|uniref:Uncharacterized protein n=1 Tax=Portunus trituberculatus TaxID=210409 RepID=A0A5B7IYN7_PORTR|nr:hypothetical protein [Portunus trituberculatus]